MSRAMSWSRWGRPREPRPDSRLESLGAAGGAARGGAEVNVLGIGAERARPLRRLVVGPSRSRCAGHLGRVCRWHARPGQAAARVAGTVHVGRVKLKPGKPFTSRPCPATGCVRPPGFPVSSWSRSGLRPAGPRKMQGFTSLHRPTPAGPPRPMTPNQPRSGRSTSGHAAARGARAGRGNDRLPVLLAPDVAGGVMPSSASRRR